MKLSRRDMLTSILGAPLAGAMAGCEQRPAAPPVQGGFVEPSMALGHRLRKAPPSDDEMAAAPQQSVDAVIVGGGPAGLSAARALQQGGVTDFRLLELEPQLGGTSRSEANSHPWGAHYLTVPSADNADLVALLSEMGALEGKDPDGHPMGSERHLVTEPKERIFYRGYWYEGLYPHQGASKTDQQELLRFQQLVAGLADLKDGAGCWAFALPLSSSSDDPDLTGLDRMSASQWLSKQGLASKRLHWYLSYACQDDYGLGLEHTSAWAMLFYFASRVPRPGRPAAPVLTWPEGNGAIVNHLARPMTEHVQRDALVVDVVPHATGAHVHVLAERGQRPLRLHAKRVILAVPSFVAARLLRPFRQTRPAHLDNMHYGAWLSANLHLRQRPRQRGYAPAWDNVIYDSPSLGYVDATHQLGQSIGPTIWTYYMAMTDGRAADGRRRLLQPSWEDYRDAIRADLGRAHADLDEHLTRLDVCRWGHGMIQPRVGLIFDAGLRAAHKPQGAVHFAHTDLSGMALFEEAFAHGMRAGREVVAALHDQGPT